MSQERVQGGNRVRSVRIEILRNFPGEVVFKSRLVEWIEFRNIKETVQGKWRDDSKDWSTHLAYKSSDFNL